MATNQYVNKVVVGNNTIFDCSGDTVSPTTLLEGITAHSKTGATITGTCTFDSDTSDATANVAEILAGETAYVAGSKVTGTMTNRGGVDTDITTKAQVVSIASGYHDGSGTTQISATEQAKIIPSNIKQGVVILGQTGTLEPSSAVTAQAKTVTSSLTAQTILPDSDYDYLSQVIINAIPKTEVDNASGGVTVTIG